MTIVIWTLHCCIILPQCLIDFVLLHLFFGTCMGMLIYWLYFVYAMNALLLSCCLLTMTIKKLNWIVLADWLQNTTLTVEWTVAKNLNSVCFKKKMQKLQRSKYDIRKNIWIWFNELAFWNEVMTVISWVCCSIAVSHQNSGYIIQKIIKRSHSHHSLYLQPLQQFCHTGCRAISVSHPKKTTVMAVLLNYKQREHNHSNKFLFWSSVHYHLHSIH